MHQLERCAGALRHGSFFARLACEQLCRLPTARRFLHQALSTALESWLDAARHVAGRPSDSAAEASRARQDSLDGHVWRSAPAAVVGKVFSGMGTTSAGDEIGAAEAAALRRLLDAVSRRAPALPVTLETKPFFGGPGS